MSLEYSLYDAELLRSKGLVITEDAELGLAIVRYHKSDNQWRNDNFGECNREDPFVRKHRSVVYSLESKCVIHASPQRRKSDHSVVIKTLKINNWIVSPYIDGTMISLFWSPVTNEWIMSSRSKFHAAGNFMSKFPFRDLFKQAIPNGWTLGDFLLEFNREYTYTFILCHPENKHVIEAKEPKIHLVHVGKCTPYTPYITSSNESGEVIVKAESLDYYQVVDVAKQIGVEHPVEIQFTDNNSLWEYSQRIIGSNKPEGMMLTPSPENSCNERIRILSNVYDTCIRLRGNSPSIQTNIIRLWANDPMGNLLNDYTTYYPGEKEVLRDTIRTIHESSNELELYYKNRHVRKSMEHDDLPHWARKPIWDLHGIYLRERQPINHILILEYYRKQSASFVNRILKSRKKELERDQDKAIASSE